MTARGQATGRVAGFVRVKLLVALGGLAVGFSTGTALQMVHFEIGAAEIFRVAGAVLGLWMTLLTGIGWRILRTQVNREDFLRLEDRVDAIPGLIAEAKEETANRVTGPLLDLETRVRDLERGA